MPLSEEQVGPLATELESSSLGPGQLQGQRSIGFNDGSKLT